MTAVEQRTYGIRRTLALGYDDAVARVREALMAEGFGVLTEIDVKATLEKKLGVTREPYVILGACNPVLANQALTAEPEVGLLLPCNVVVRAHGGETIVEAMDPGAAMGIVQNPAIHDVAEQAKAKLTRALEALPG
ncbi:MAG: DUF302 domain-containing protein [Dehalococcoidia bacterium]|nr:DUF302 domain-containing protein [Dehalococcoidia bacterium]